MNHPVLSLQVARQKYHPHWLNALSLSSVWKYSPRKKVILRKLSCSFALVRYLITHNEGETSPLTVCQSQKPSAHLPLFKQSHSCSLWKFLQTLRNENVRGSQLDRLVVDISVADIRGECFSGAVDRKNEDRFSCCPWPGVT